MKKLLIFTFFLLLFLDTTYSTSTLSTCKYSSEIDECNKARASGTTRMITEYICPQSVSNEEMVYQIIFDKRFKTIDKEALNFLATLENSKDLCFGPNSKMDYISCINYIDKTFGKGDELWNRYYQTCDPQSKESVYTDFIQCYDKTRVINFNDYFGENDCGKFLEYKFDVYKTVSYNVLKMNKIQIIKDFRKKQFQQIRTKYDKLIDSMMENLDSVSRINMMWNYKTENPK